MWFLHSGPVRLVPEDCHDLAFSDGVEVFAVDLDLEAAAGVEDDVIADLAFTGNVLAADGESAFADSDDGCRGSVLLLCLGDDDAPRCLRLLLVTTDNDTWAEGTSLGLGPAIGIPCG